MTSPDVEQVVVTAWTIGDVGGLGRVPAVHTGPGQQPTARRGFGLSAGRMAHLLTEIRPETLLERGREGLIRALGRPRGGNATDGRRRYPGQRMPGQNMWGKFRAQPAGKPANRDRRAAQQQGAGSIRISGVGRQSQRLGTGPRALRSQVQGHAHTTPPLDVCTRTAPLRLTDVYQPVSACVAAHTITDRCGAGTLFARVVCRKLSGGRSWID